MAVVDPRARQQERKEKGWDNENTTDRLKEEGKFLFGVIGWERFLSASKGTPGLMIRFIVLEGPRAGAVIDVDFWLTERALGALADLALANGWEEPFDADSDESLELIFPGDRANALIGVVKAEPYTKNDGTAGVSYKIAFFNRYKGVDKEDEWQPIMEQGFTGWEVYTEWRKKNPRKAPGEARASSGAGGGARQVAESRAAGGPANNDDIPF